jgi:DNA invertase Pin-like site-specific DNA recombinase
MTALVPFNTVEDRGDKILPRHLEQTAVVYIRQSSMQQVHRNQESTKIQYGLAGLAEKLGWAPDRVVVIDDDLGISGASAIGREGFQRLLAEVALDHVGVILGVEMSRLARSNKDWHQLLELCARFGTLIADLDGLYDPSRYNDRLLLGLKGTMSEAELHILRQRLLQGKLHKARRGELAMSVPTGYLKHTSGEITLDPDEEVQGVVRLVFEEFDRIGTLHGVLRSLATKGAQVGVRRRVRPDIGKLEWHPPHRQMVLNILRNPIYAGTYVYGRRRIDPRRQKPGRPATGKTPFLPPEQWHACVRDRFPAYITWDHYEQNQRKLKANREHGDLRNGAYGKSPALLGGLVACARCRYRMCTQHQRSANGRRYSRYVCNRAAATRGLEVCSGLSSRALDDSISQLALDALRPAALEVSMRVSEEIERERAKADALWQKRLQRARYEVERAERQYQAVEPENRLVARSLERAWEEKLQAERVLQEEYRRREEQQPRCLTAAERETIRRLASDLPVLWNATTTTNADRKAVLRLLVERIFVDANKDSEWVSVTVQWTGGHETQTRLRRPVGAMPMLSNHKQLLARIHELRRDGYTAGMTADKLNAEGWVTATQRNGFNERLVRMILHRYGTVERGPKRPPSGDPNQVWLTDLADELEMPWMTLYGWMRRGWLKAYRVRGQWAVAVPPEERRRLERLRRRNPSPIRKTRRKRQTLS